TLASPYACAPRTTATPRPALPAALPLRPRDAVVGRGPRADRVGRGHRQPPARGVGVLSPTVRAWLPFVAAALACGGALGLGFARSEEHTSELQSRENLGCRVLRGEKKSL